MRPKKATKVLGRDPINEPEGTPEAILVHLLRRTAESGGVRGCPTATRARRGRTATARSAGSCSPAGTIAERDQLGKELINDGIADAFDLHTLEVVLDGLAAMSGPEWGGGVSNRRATEDRRPRA